MRARQIILRLKADYHLFRSQYEAAAEDFAQCAANILKVAAGKAVTEDLTLRKKGRRKTKVRIDPLLSKSTLVDDQMIESKVNKAVQPIIAFCAQHGVQMKVKIKQRPFRYNSDHAARVTARFRPMPSPQPGA